MDLLRDPPPPGETPISENPFNPQLAIITYYDAWFLEHYRLYYPNQTLLHERLLVVPF